MTNQKLSLIAFQKKFATEEACYQYLYNIRWPDGFVCPKCSHPKGYHIVSRKLIQCANPECRYQASITAGTIMHRTRTPLVKWFLAIYLAARDKRGISAMALAKEIDVTYKTAWLMLHKIRKAMRDRNARYMLSGIVEIDDAFFGSPTRGGKRGRGTEKSKVICAISLDEEGRPKYLKMEVVSDIKASTLGDFACRNIQAGSKISSDAYHSYKQLGKDGKFEHEFKHYDPHEDSQFLKWLHTVIGNAKAFIEGTYHGLGKKHLQSYLEEFCYRFNRRWMQNWLFDRLLVACTSTPTITYAELTA